MNYEVANSSAYYRQLSLKRYFNSFITPHQRDVCPTFNLHTASFLFSFLNLSTKLMTTDKLNNIKKAKMQKIILDNVELALIKNQMQY